VESIPSAPVAEAMSRVLQSLPPSAEIRSLDTVSTEVRKLIADAAIRYTEAQRDRHKRLEVIVECEMRIRKLERTCQERLEALEGTGTANLKAGSSSST